MAKSPSQIAKLYCDIAQISQGIEYYWKYAHYQRGTHGLGKTAERCVLYVGDKVFNLSLRKGHEQSFIDVIDDTNKSLIQVKTTYGTSNDFGFGRIEANEGETTQEIAITKANYRKTEIKKLLTKFGCRYFLLLHIDTKNQIYSVFHLATLEKNGEVTFHGEALEKYQIGISENSTHTSVKFDGLRLLHRKQNPDLRKFTFSELKLNEVRVDISTLSESEQVAAIRECANKAIFHLREMETFFLGKDFGDKGISFEKFIIDELSVAFTGFVVGSASKTPFCDIYIPGSISVQVKYNELTHTDIVFYNSALVVRPIKTVCDFYDPPQTIYHVDKVRTKLLRINDVKEKLLGTLTKVNVKKEIMFAMDRETGSLDIFLLAENAKNTLTTYGTFLSPEYVISAGGKNGTQRNFNIYREGLQPYIIN